MAQIMGKEDWEQLLFNNNGNRRLALKEAETTYGLSSDEDDVGMQSSWQSLLTSKGSLGEGDNTWLWLGTDGQIHYDLTGLESTEQLLQKIQDHFDVSYNYAEALLADLETHSDTLGEDLFSLDSQASWEDYVKSRAYKKDGKILFDLTDSDFKRFGVNKGDF
jgi:hypothetical protein